VCAAGLHQEGFVDTASANAGNYNNIVAASVDYQTQQYANYSSSHHRMQVEVLTHYGSALTTLSSTSLKLLIF
jgi:hypothetical protein